VGTSFSQKLYESGGMQILNKASSMLGLMMMGSMTASNVNFETILEVNVAGSEETMQIQEYLDQLFVGIVPLAVTLGAFWLLRKKVNVNWVMLGIMCLGILLGLLGIA
ncbi:PTS system mannose/fructose/sorbose family transporter subunit IID, partial [Lactiplantibacillus plantarum]|uniref:PTS system mannose/fructose/sorbose family transporter subunit IID n=1 Tax=Lactiplantibacillus plantarum TaxID=1590 RepID=UPI003C240DB3